MKNWNEILNNESFTKKEIVELLKVNDKDKIKELHLRASEVRQQYCGNEIHLRGIIEFSNYCRQDCTYCGLRKSNTKVTRYRMTKNEILATAENICNSGIKTIVLQSGEDTQYSGKEIEEIIKKIKEKIDVAITLSLGERKFEDYKLWKEAGADRYLLKQETANREIYSQIHPLQDYDNKIKHLKYLKKIGYQIGSGNIVGLPYQTVDDIAEDILLCKELDVDMASFSPFISAEHTPLSENPNGDIFLLLKTMAVARLVLKNVHIPSTTALATLDKEGRKKGVLSGANVIMPNFTPFQFRSKYIIYNNKKCIDENPNVFLGSLKTEISQLGFCVSNSKGHSLKQEVVFIQ